MRPGIMPTLFGRHMIGNAIFITLDEMAEGLPDMFEYIGSPMASARRRPCRPAMPSSTRTTSIDTSG